MSKTKTPVAQAVATSLPDMTPASYKDAAYKAAIIGEGNRTIAAWIYAKCPKFADEVPKEIKAELMEGWMLRWQELNPAVSYDSNTLVANENGNLQATIAWAMSYSQQAYGQLKKEDPVRHGIIGDLRTRFSKYISNRLSDMQGAVRKIDNATKPPKTREQAKGFSKYLSETFADIKKQNTNARSRGDTEVVDDIKLRMAIDAFYDVVNK